MKEKKYTFPVVMGNKRILKDHDILHYPSQILVTPSGRYLKILHRDW